MAYHNHNMQNIPQFINVFKLWAIFLFKFIIGCGVECLSLNYFLWLEFVSYALFVATSGIPVANLGKLMSQSDLPIKPSQCKGHVRWSLQNGVVCGHLVEITGSMWKLRGVRGCYGMYVAVMGCMWQPSNKDPETL